MVDSLLKCFWAFRKALDFFFLMDDNCTTLDFGLTQSRCHIMMLSAPVEALFLPVGKKEKRVVNKLLGIIQ